MLDAGQRKETHFCYGTYVKREILTSSKKHFTRYRKDLTKCRVRKDSYTKFYKDVKGFGSTRPATTLHLRFPVLQNKLTRCITITQFECKVSQRSSGIRNISVILKNINKILSETERAKWEAEQETPANETSYGFVTYQLIFLS